MKLSKLYTSRPEYFPPIKFNDGLNVVIGKITRPEDYDRDSHNLGKSLLIDVIDFCLLKKLTPDHFTKKLPEKLNEIEFYLEVFLSEEKFLTIKRGIEKNTKIYFKKSSKNNQDLTKIHKDDWVDFPSFQKSKDFLNGNLSLTSMRPFDYRKGISYFLRKQKDYMDVFQVEKFIRSEHKEWKPYIGKILGFSHEEIEKKYDYNTEIELKTNELNELKSKLNYPDESLDKVRARREAEDQRVQELEIQLDNFDFKKNDLEISEEELQKLDEEISYINNEIYNLTSDLNRISDSIKRKISFKTENIKKIFGEVGIYFQDQILKEYEDLERFNKNITQDRNKRLKKEKERIDNELNALKETLESRTSEKVSKLEIIREKDTFKKYKKMQNELLKYKTDLQALDNDLKRYDKLREKRKEINALDKILKETIDKLRNEVETGNNTLFNIRSFFRDIVKKVLSTEVLLYVDLNKENNIDFFAKYTRNDDPTSPTSEDQGTSYYKLLCAFFDLAVLRCYKDSKFYHFVYHDGILEGLDNRKKLLLIQMIKDYTKKYNIQYILTAIDSDLPTRNDGQKFEFSDEEIIRELTDEGDKGRLFNCEVF